MARTATLPVSVATVLRIRATVWLSAIATAKAPETAALCWAEAVLPASASEPAPLVVEIRRSLLASTFIDTTPVLARRLIVVPSIYAAVSKSVITPDRLPAAAIENFRGWPPEVVVSAGSLSGELASCAMSEEVSLSDAHLLLLRGSSVDALVRSFAGAGS
ncbi:MAG: hypothetical protein M1823_007208 [Watsoniomyces obsoletus]|nr:MAG: hypothetical protein M1823_007208 [Watsoniomyces obsoletus]